MTEPARDLLEKNVTLTNGLKIHYYERPGPPAALVRQRHTPMCENVGA